MSDEMKTKPKKSPDLKELTSDTVKLDHLPLFLGYDGLVQAKTPVKSLGFSSGLSVERAIEGQSLVISGGSQAIVGPIG